MSDKVANNPHLLPYAHTVGSSIIKPIDKGKIKGRSLNAMYEQTKIQFNQIEEQINLLVDQANKIKERVEISEFIYQSDIGFDPVINHIYHLYQRNDGTHMLSLIDPNEWKNNKLMFISSVKLLSDKTWQIIKQNDKVN